MRLPKKYLVFIRSRLESGVDALLFLLSIANVKAKRGLSKCGKQQEFTRTWKQGDLDGVTWRLFLHAVTDLFIWIWRRKEIYRFLFNRILSGKN